MILSTSSIDSLYMSLIFYYSEITLGQLSPILSVLSEYRVQIKHVEYFSTPSTNVSYSGSKFYLLSVIIFFTALYYGFCNELSLLPSKLSLSGDMQCSSSDIFEMNLI